MPMVQTAFGVHSFLHAQRSYVHLSRPYLTVCVVKFKSEFSSGMIHRQYGEILSQIRSSSEFIYDVFCCNQRKRSNMAICMYKLQKERGFQQGKHVSISQNGTSLNGTKLKDMLIISLVFAT